MNEERIPQDEIDRANSDIVSVISRHIPLKKGGKNWFAVCPFHKEKSGSFTVKEGDEFYYCFGCGAGGNAIKFVMEYTGCSFRAAVESINGSITLESSGAPRVAAAPRAIRCDLPGHAEDREKCASILSTCEHVPQHQYLKSNNTAPCGDVLQRKGALIVPLINNIGEQVNLAAITLNGITYAAGKPSFGSTAILEPAAEHDGKTIICSDYAYAWRMWWAHGGRSRVLCAMSGDNLTWMLAQCRDRFTHVGCDPLESDWYEDEGHQVVCLPLDPYLRSSGVAAATKVDRECQCA